MHSHSKVSARRIGLFAALFSVASIFAPVHRVVGDDQGTLRTPQFSIKCTSATFSFDGKFLAANENGHVVIRRVADMKAIQQLMPDCGSVSLIAWSRDDKYIAAAMFGGFGSGVNRSQIEVWRTDTWQPTGYIPTKGHARSIVFSPTSDTFAVSTGDYSVTLWDCARNRPVSRFSASVCGPLDFSPDGKLIAGVHQFLNNGYVRNIKSGRIVMHLPTAFGCVAFSPDGKSLSCGNIEDRKANQLAVWDIRTGECRLTGQGMDDSTTIKYVGENTLFARSERESRVIKLFNDKVETNSDFAAILAVSDDNTHMLVKPHDRDSAVLQPSWFQIPPTNRMSRPAATIDAVWASPLTRIPAGTPVKVGLWRTAPSAVVSDEELSKSTTEESLEAPSKEIAHDRTGTWSAFVRHQTQGQAVITDIIVTNETPQGRKTYCFHIHNDIYRVVWSPCGRYLACEYFSDFSNWVPHPWGLFHLSTGQISAVPINGSYYDRIEWSPDDKYLALYGEGLEGSRYSTQRVLYCWDIAKNRVTPIVTGWQVRACWPADANGKLRFVCEGGKVDTFDPVTNQIDVTSNNIDTAN